MEKLPIIIFRNVEGKILLQFRDSNAPSTALGWSFFGGVTESDETPLQGLIREVHEELGFDFQEKDVRLLVERKWIDEHSKKEKIVYLYEAIAPIEWKDLDIKEGAGAAFLTKEEIQATPTVSTRAKTLIKDHC